MCVCVLKVTRAVLEEIEASRAVFTLYEGALFHHQGATYIVRELRFQECIALVERRAVPYWTRIHDYTDVEILHRRQTRALPAGQAIYGDMRVRKVVYACVGPAPKASPARRGILMPVQRTGGRGWVTGSTRSCRRRGR